MRHQNIVRHTFGSFACLLGTTLLLTMSVGTQASTSGAVSIPLGQNFSGLVTEIEMGITDTFGMSLSFDSLSGSQVTGSGSTDAGEVFSFQGSVIVSGGQTIVSGTFESTDLEDGTVETGTFTATFVDASTIDVSYQEDLLAFSGSGILTGGAVGASSDSSATGQQRQGSAMQQLSVLFKRVHGTRGQSGATQLGGGFLIRPEVGQAAGDSFGDFPFGVWASYQHNDSEDDFAGTAFDSDQDSLFVGVDFTPWDNFVAGVALGFGNSDVDTTFNGGNQDIDEFSVIPYLGANLSDNVGVDFDLGFDLAIGYTNLDVDQFRTSGAARVTSSTEADRFFVIGNVNAGKAFGNLYVNGTAGLIVARDDYDAFRESDGSLVGERRFDLGQVRFGGDASYYFDTGVGGVEPFVGAIYEYDYQHEDITVAGATQPANDVNDVLFNTGLRWYANETFSASFEYSSVLSREDFDSDSYSFQIRGEF